MLHRFARLFALGVALALAACGTDAPEIVDLSGSLELEGAVPDPAREGGWLVDLGGVQVDREGRALLTLRNASARGLNVEASPLEAPFSSTLGERASIGAHQRLAFEVIFAPDERGGREAELLLSSRLGSLQLRLRAEGVIPSVACRPGKVDFLYLAAMNETVTQLVTCTNDTKVDVVLTVPPIEGDPAFAWGDGVVPGARMPLAPGASIELPVDYTPRETRYHEAGFRPVVDDGAVLPRVRLEGWARAGDLVVAPSGDMCLFFSPLALGESREEWITFYNLSSRPIRILSIEVPEGYSIDRGLPIELPADDPDNLLIDSELVLPIRFTPTQLGPWPGVVRITTDDEKEPVREICLAGYAGGPALSCDEGGIDFGEVAAGVRVNRSIRCTNAGTGTIDQEVAWLRIFSVGATNSAFWVRLHDPNKTAFAPGESFLVDVSAIPMAAREYYGAAMIASSDVEFDGGGFPLRAQGVELPPCDYAIEPAAIDFGAVAPGGKAVRDLRIRNRGTAACLVHDLRLGEESDPAFSLPGGAIVSQRLEAGEELPVEVAFAPEHAAPLVGGNAVVQLSNGRRPSVVVPLSGVAETSCLAIAEPTLDLGMVVPGCSSGLRSLHLYNRCEVPVAVDGLELGAASPFSVEAPLPLVIPAGEGATVGVRFTPGEEGSFAGILRIHGDASVPYAVALAGSGGLEGQIDRFPAGVRQPLDLLWVVGGGAADAQARAAAEAQALVAGLAGWDFRIGITGAASAGCESPADGRLLPLVGERFLDPADADRLAERLGAPICGSGGGTFAAAARALELAQVVDDPAHPEMADGNAGFLRAGAPLALIFLATDDDGSGGTVESWIDRWAAHTARDPRLLSVHGIVGGARHLAAIDQVGGGSFSAAEPAYAEGIDAILRALRGLVAHLPLTGIPLDTDGDGRLSSLELQVAVDGVELASRDPQGNERWRWDSGAGGIVFAPGAVPSAAASIEVRYWPACR